MQLRDQGIGIRPGADHDPVGLQEVTDRVRLTCELGVEAHPHPGVDLADECREP